MHQPAGKHVGSTWCFQTGEQMSHPRAVAEVSRGLTPFMCSSAALGVRRGSHHDPARDGIYRCALEGLEIGWSEENSPSGRFPSAASTSVGRAVKAAGDGLVTPEGIQYSRGQKWV